MTEYKLINLELPFLLKMNYEDLNFYEACSMETMENMNKTPKD